METHAANTPDAATELGAVVRALEHLPAPAYLVVADADAGFPFVGVNAAAARIVERTRAEIVGTPLRAFENGSGLVLEAVEAHRRVVETGRPDAYSVLLDRPQGRVFVRCSLAPLLDASGGVTHIVGVACELTPEVRSQVESEAEERRRRAQEELEARARADALVADASTRLLSAPADLVGDVVVRALGQFCDLTGADHAALWRADATERRFFRAYTWSHPAVGDAIERAPADATADEMPWADEHTERSDEPLFVADVDEMPAEAAVEQALLRSLGIRSLVSVTIDHDDRLLGVVSVAWVRAPAGSTTAATFPALRILGNSLLAALDRARAEEALRRRRDAEALVAEIARELVAATPPQVDGAITRGLERTARFVGAQGASLVTFDPDRQRSLRTHLWDIDEQRVGQWTEERAPATDRWIRDRLRDRDAFLARVPDDLASVVPELRARLVLYGVRAIGYLPLRSGGRLLGWVTVVWFEGDPPADAEVTLPALRVLGEVYLLALERARAAENLRKSARSLEWAQAAAHIGSWSYEPDTGTITWSDELFRILGFEPGSVAPGPEMFHRVVAPPEEGAITDVSALSDVGDPNCRRLRRAVRPDGEERLLVTDFEVERGVDGRVLHILGTVQDVTERVAAEQAVRDSEARFRALVLESGELIQLLDADTTVLYASPAVERDVGWDIVGSRLSDRRLAERLHHEDRDRVIDAFMTSLRRPREPVEVAFRLRDRSGKVRYREAILTNLLDDPRVKAVVLNARDTTDRRELEEQLRESQKMEAVGQLAGGIAHDFNNLLTAITGYTALLLDDARDPGMRADLEQIQRAADRAAALVEKLLQFSRRQPTNPVVLDVNEVIESLGSLFQRVIGEHITLETVLAPGAGLVRVDRSHIEQVVINFVVNARDAMPLGGTLTIESRDVVLESEDAERIGLRPGRHLRLDVTDTGTGMDEAVTARVFEPFFTTKGVGKGTGLGLSTVYGIVTQAGGHVSVSSRSGEGTTFTVHLPVVPSGTPPETAAAVRRLRSASNGPAAPLAAGIDGVIP